MDDRYKAYLLRLKREVDSLNWRVTLQNAESGETLYFSDEREFLRYLLQELAVDTPQPDQTYSP